MGFQKVGWIGCGNMGGALAAACAKGAGEALLADTDRARAEKLAQACGGKTADNRTVAERCDLIFLGVKPQVLDTVLGELAPVLAARKDRFVLLSMAAGRSIASVRKAAGGPYPVIRIMPNTPVAAGAGMILYCTADVTEDEEQDFLHLMEPAGITERLEEGLIDAGCALSGCGPAFVYQFIEALADGGVACGLPRDKAQRCAAQTVAGAAKMVLESGRHPGELKDAVCSPGGATIQGVRSLEESAFRGAVTDAVIAAYEKTTGLG